MSNTYKCIDAGRQGCPCSLAGGGKCLGCSRLAGGNCNDCSWQGTCIYTLYQQNRKAISVPSREEQLVNIIEKKQYGKTLTVFVVEVDKGCAQRAMRPGAYVFARGMGEDRWGDVALTILKAEPEQRRIHLAVSSCGPKSINLVKCDDKIIIRGIYFNGLIGMDSLDEEAESCQVFAKGVSIACLRNFLDGGYVWSRYLRNMKLYIDIEKIDMDFLKEYFGDLPVSATQIVEMRECLSGQEPGGEDFDRCGEQGNVIALVSPFYVKEIEEIFHGEVVRPNGAKVCCGEGLCGACSMDDQEGKTIHLCKARS